MFLIFFLVLLIIFSMYLTLKVRFYSISFFDKIITTILLFFSLLMFVFSIFFGEFYLPPNRIDISERIVSHSIEKKDSDHKRIIIYDNPHLLDFPKISFSKLVYYSWIWKFPFLILFIYLMTYILAFMFKKSKHKITD